MFGLLKKINGDREVTTNPGVLFRRDIETSELKVHGLKLQDNAELIPLEKISTTTFEKAPPDILYFPNGGTKQTWKDNKVYYECPNGVKEYFLADRIKSVLDFGGILHMGSGAKYVIRDRLIIGIGIHQGIVAPFQKISKEKIEKKFGPASKIEEDYEQTDGELWNTTYFYDNRNMIINFFEPDNEINFINIGLFRFELDTKVP
ncbi:MAG: hypothetical protein V4722_24355 [Bacteroidota bacterium]